MELVVLLGKKEMEVDYPAIGIKKLKRTQRRRMDNRIFNINGIGEDMLKAALKLAFQQTGTNVTLQYEHLGE